MGRNTGRPLRPMPQVIRGPSACTPDRSPSATYQTFGVGLAIGAYRRFVHPNFFARHFQESENAVAGNAYRPLGFPMGKFSRYTL